MSRVILAFFVAFSVAACSLGPSTLSTGFTDDRPTTASLHRQSPSSLGANATSSKKGARVAALNDQAPKGSYEKPANGALAGRDYSSTTLRAEMARDVINHYRKEKGLKPLRLSPELTEAAKAHARDLAKWDRISHYGSDGSNPWDRVKRTGYKARLAAENVGTGQVTFEEVMRGWKESPGHNKNLLMADADHMGIALVQDNNTEFKSFWTLVLGSPQ